MSCEKTEAKKKLSINLTAIYACKIFLEGGTCGYHWEEMRG
jgi:hypothetical protein